MEQGLLFFALRHPFWCLVYNGDKIDAYLIKSVSNELNDRTGR